MQRGGLIAVGIEDDGSITGVNADQENCIRQAAFDHLQIPPECEIEIAACTNETGEDVNIMLFHIRPSANEIIKLKSGEAYLRVGDSSRKLNSEMLAALEYSKGIKSFESRIIEDATFDDLNQELVKQYIDLLDPTVSSPIDVLKGRGLIKEKNGEYKLTVAAILLYTSPAFVIIMSAIIWREKITKNKLCALVLTFTGSVLVSGYTAGDLNITLYGFFSSFQIKTGTDITVFGIC